MAKKKKQQVQPVQQTTTFQAAPAVQPAVDAASKALVTAAQHPPTLAAPAPLDPQQLAAQQQALAAEPAISGVTGGAAQGVNFLTNPSSLYASSNPYLQSYIDAAIHPITDTYSNVTLPAIQQDAILNSGVGGSRAGVAQGIASQGLLRQIGDTTANIASTGYGQGLQGLESGISQAPATAAALTLPAQVTGAVGTQNQTQAQNVLDVANANQFLPVSNAADIISAANTVPGGVQTSILPGTNVQGTATTKKPSTLNSVLGGAASGAGIGSAFGPLGTIAGGGLGALYGLFGNK